MIDIYHTGSEGEIRAFYISPAGDRFDFHAYPDGDGGWAYWHLDDMTEDDFLALHDELNTQYPQEATANE